MFAVFGSLRIVRAVAAKRTYKRPQDMTPAARRAKRRRVRQRIDKGVADDRDRLWLEQDAALQDAAAGSADSPSASEPAAAAVSSEAEPDRAEAKPEPDRAQPGPEVHRTDPGKTDWSIPPRKPFQVFEGGLGGGQSGPQSGPGSAGASAGGGAPPPGTGPQAAPGGPAPQAADFAELARRIVEPIKAVNRRWKAEDRYHVPAEPLELLEWATADYLRERFPAGATDELKQFRNAILGVGFGGTAAAGAGNWWEDRKAKKEVERARQARSVYRRPEPKPEPPRPEPEPERPVEPAPERPRADDDAGREPVGLVAGLVVE